MQPGRSYERLPLAAARSMAAERQTPAVAAAEHPVPGKRTLTEALEAVPVQRIAAGPTAPAAARPGDIARRGVEGGGGPLPHGATIQQLFGRHDISQVTAHQGPAAREAANALGAKAFTYGNKIAFHSSPDLHTAAHEAAHAVQQRQGVQLAGGIDVPGDPYERHADAVADAVVAGRSAAALLDQMPGGGAHAAVQRTWTRDAASRDADLDPDGPWYQDRDRVYRNLDTGDSYDPIHRIFDNRDEPASFHEVDDREHLELMRAIHGGRMVSVYFDDSSEQVYDPATRRLYPGRVLGERFRQLGADEHDELMAKIQLDLDYQEYLDSGEADHDHGEFRGRRDGYEDSEFRSEEEDCEHPDAYAEGYRDGYRQGVFERGYDRACADFYDDRDFDDTGGGDHADDYAEGYAAGWNANRRTDGDDLPIFELTQNGRFITQDDRGFTPHAREKNPRYYHIGRELAYTCDMKTCTALTMYSEVTQLSYLKHVDAATDPELIGAEIQEYLEQVAEAMPEDSEEDPIATIDTHLFYGRQTSPEEDNSSIEAISNGIKAALQDEPGFKAFWSRIRCQKIGSEDRAGDTDYVVVGGGLRPELLQVPQPEFEAALAKIHQHETMTDLEVPVAAVLRRLAKHADDIRAVIPADEIERAYAEASSYDLEIQAALAPFRE